MIGIGGSLAAPPLPHHRTYGSVYGGSRSYANPLDQGRETERFEVGIGESHGEGFAPGEMPGSMTAAGHVAQLPPDSQRDECGSPRPWCFPLAPEGSPQSQADPASESDQHLGRLAEAEIAAPTPHIRSQLFHYRLHAGALGPSRDVPDSLLEPVQRFRRDR